MDSFFGQFQLLHTLLPYFPATNRTLFSYILYYLEFQHLVKAIQVEQDLLAAAPANPKFPEGNAFIELLTRNLPPQEAQRIKQMMDMMQMMDTMKDLNPSGPTPFAQNRAEPSGQQTHREAPRAAPQGMQFSGNSVTPDLLKNMMSPKQQQLFEQYQALFQGNAQSTPPPQPAPPRPTPPPNPYDY